jgi:hypothetical protein
LGKLERLIAVQTHQFFVHAERGAAGGQTQTQRRISADGVGDDPCSFAAEFFLAGF